MTRPGWIVAAIAPVAVVAAAVRPAPPTPGVDGIPTPRPEASVAAPVVGTAVGQGGCSSTGCHGAPTGDPFRAPPGPTTWSTSALVWLAADPHRNAYAALESPLAVRMMCLLTGEAAPGVPNVKATDEVRCLACHTNPVLAGEKGKDPHAKLLRQQGVGCEACHGNASGWLQSHTSFTPETRAAGYEKGGMTKLYDLGERAVACAGCHVGAPASADGTVPLRDMNHDMIAAGHPKLNFDFATYQFMLPRHWFERDRTKPGSAADPDFEARAWLVGRVAHAEAACALTADRAARANPWPEFAESSCVACHHTFNNHFEKKTAGPTYPNPVGRRPGSLPWQPIWPVTRAASFAPLNPGQAGDSVAAVMKGMQVSRPPVAVGATAKTASGRLSLLRARLAGLSGPDAFTTAGAVLNTARGISDAEWDRDLAEQVYYGRTAVERARIARGAGDPKRYSLAAEKLRLTRGTVPYYLPPGDAKAIRDSLK